MIPKVWKSAPAGRDDGRQEATGSCVLNTSTHLPNQETEGAPHDDSQQGKPHHPSKAAMRGVTQWPNLTKEGLAQSRLHADLFNGAGEKSESKNIA